MDQTVVGMFDTAAQAQQAVQKLAAAGFSREYVDVSTGKPNSGGDASNYQNTSGTAVEGAADAAGRATTEAKDSIGGFFSNLFGGDDDEDTQRYSHVARSAGSIVTVHCHSAENAHKAADILDDAGAVNVDERAAATGYQASASANTNATANNYTAPTGNASTGKNDGLTAEVIEENLQVGKRVEQTGGVRLRSRIVEKPVEASVRLREEHVIVNRTPVNRPATEADFTAFKEGQVEVTESAERAVVAKEAHVVEEVSLGKQVTEREEVVRDTVRNTEVDVEQIPGATTSTTTNKNTTTNPNQQHNS